MQRLQARVGHSGQLLGALSYRSVLTRGFALVRDEQGRALHAAASVGPGARLNLEFADGHVAATADADRPAAKPVPAKPETSEPKAATAKRVVKPVGQGSLF
jgi:exodeoxyribonuclease VII large subunit